VAVLSQTSSGAIDAAGIAPERFVDSRRGRAPRATNFQRAAGLISFSGPSLTLPLHPGVQDRLSWMLQLPAVAAANPALTVVGAQIQLFVVGARGDAELWTFVVMGHADLALPEGPVAAALHLRRAPRHAYDTRVDVWLDPARHHLPVRMRMHGGGDDGVFELRLEGLALP
jgi:hypothetical protein